MQTLRGREHISFLFLTSALDGGWVVSFTPRKRFTPQERTPGTHCTRNCVRLRAGLDTEVRRQFFTSAEDWTPVVESVVRYYTDWATPASNRICAFYQIPIYINRVRIKNVRKAGNIARMVETDRSQEVYNKWERKRSLEWCRRIWLDQTGSG
jgi:hypothetical protein